MSSQSTDLQTSRTWLIASGILFLLAGLAAIGSPLVFTVLIVRFLAFFVLASGIVSVALAIAGKHQGYRWLEALSGFIRIAAGIALLMCLKSSVAAITLVFAIYLICEGVFVAVASLKLRPAHGWILTLINGVVALVLGIMVAARWPSSSLWVLGLFFGINLAFKGAAQLGLGLSSRKPAAVAG